MTTFPPSTHKGNPSNTREMTEGEYYLNDLSMPPFDAIVPPPIKCIITHPSMDADFTCLYECIADPERVAAAARERPFDYSSVAVPADPFGGAGGLAGSAVWLAVAAAFAVGVAAQTKFALVSRLEKLVG
jgi:hypothetical protein